MILVLNGPNLNLLGRREPQVYGSQTLTDLENYCLRVGQELGVTVRCFQSNLEGELINQLHAAPAEGVRAIIFNAGAYTHTSIALRDAIAGIDVPVMEVHISNIFAREAFRHHSYLAPVCVGSISGLGFFGYEAALRYFSNGHVIESGCQPEIGHPPFEQPST